MTHPTTTTQRIIEGLREVYVASRRNEGLTYNQLLDIAPPEVRELEYTSRVRARRALAEGATPRAIARITFRALADGLPPVIGSDLDAVEALTAIATAQPHVLSL